MKQILKKKFKKNVEKKYSASITMDINLHRLTCKINLRQMPCTKSASNDIYFNLRQMPCTKSASNAMQKLKCVKSLCVNCHAKNNMRQMPLLQSSSALKITHSTLVGNSNDPPQKYCILDVIKRLINQSRLVKTGQNWSKLVETGQNWSKLVKIVKTGRNL